MIGKSNGDFANIMSTTEPAIKQRIKRLMDATGTENRTMLAIKLIERGIDATPLGLDKPLKEEPEGPEGIKLPPRLKKTAELLLVGYTNQEVADDLKITYQTAKNYVRDLMEEVGADNRLRCLLILKRRGMA